MRASSIERSQVSGLRAKLSAWYEASAWAPLAGKALAYLAGFGVLALVGSGAASGLLSKASGASAAPLNSASAVASASAAPLALRPEGAASAESASDAGTGIETDAGAATLADAGAEKGADAAAGTEKGAGAAAEKRPAPVSGVTTDGKVVLNAASEEDLRRLPGIGPSKAKAILALRAKLGKFKRPEDLLRVKGIGRRRLARLRSLLVVEPPS